jgi:hypothetical protein
MMTDFIEWLRVELLRLRSFDWAHESRSIHWLKDGVAKFSASYSTARLAAKLGISEEEILGLIDAPTVINELEQKSFTMGWKEGRILLAWLEEGISEWKVDINQNYYEEDGRFYLDWRFTDKIIYLDRTERIVKDMRNEKRVCITEEAFRLAMEQIRRNAEKNNI